MAEDPGGKLGSFQEPGIVRTRTGRIIAAIRNQGPDNAIWTTYSDDDGKTWKPVKQSPDDWPSGRPYATDGRPNTLHLRLASRKTCGSGRHSGHI